MITKKHIESLGWDVEEIDDQIWLIKNFMLESHTKEILDFCESTPEENWTHFYLDALRKFAFKKFKTDDIKSLEASGKLDITWNWVDKNIAIVGEDIKKYVNEKVGEIVSADSRLMFNGLHTIQRQYEGAELITHVDNQTDPSLEWAIIIYINDDYTNGELVFPDRGIQIRPKARSLLMFPTHEGYRHGVNPPGPGPKRYVLPSFVAIKNFYETHTY